MINRLDSILKSRDITLSTKVCLVKATVFPVVMYGCESWTMKKGEHWRIDAFELWCWRKFLRRVIIQFSSVQFSRSVVSNSLRPHESQQPGLPVHHQLPELLKLMSIESVIPSNYLILCRPLLLPPSIFPASGSFPMNQLFASGGQRNGVSALASVLPKNTQDWSL